MPSRFSPVKPHAARMILAAVFAMLCSAPAAADVKPHALFSDGMVLQRGRPTVVWGTAAEGEEVTVMIDGRTASTTAVDGKWRVQLPSLEAGGPHELVIEGADRVAIKDVLVGEVWICSGQSNMQWPLTRTKDAEQAIAAAANDKIRLFTVPRQASEEPRRNVDAAWASCTPDTAADFSAVAYYFGRDLEAHLDVPIGLISTNYGGTPAEAWTSRETLAEQAELRHYQEAERNIQNARRPYGLYNAMIHPLLPYRIRGAIWYQGESNAGQAYVYRTLFPTMIADWRQAWGQGDFPFLFVQLAPFMKITTEPAESAWAELREAQLMTMLNVPQTAMAVITDVGEEDDIHPQVKEPVGARLALAARALAYGETIEYSGPIFASAASRDGGLLLAFEHIGDGLVAKDGPLTGFTLAGEDRVFHAAKAEIVGAGQILVASDAVAEPRAVRYGWANFPTGNLWNANGLPASPFRSDDFPGVTQPQP